MTATHPPYLWWNGKRIAWEEATVHVTQLAWSGVAAVFEGIQAYWNADEEELFVFRLDAHLERFQRSQKMMRMNRDYTTTQLTDAIIDLLRANECRGDTYVFPLAFLGGGGGFRKISAIDPSQTEITITTRPQPSHLLQRQWKHACVSSWTRISDNVLPPRIKNISNYRNSQLASTEASLNGYDTPILLNAQGKVAEGPGSCLMLVRDGVLITPGVTESILESITRASLIDLARDVLGLGVVERSVDRTELYIADELFLCGTAAEITPIVSVDRYTVGDGEQGPITSALERAFHDVVRGNDPRYRHWLTPVGVAATATAG